jgi:predicted TIM-barrel fold metal-dependent hydrolase
MRTKRRAWPIGVRVGPLRTGLAVISVFLVIGPVTAAEPEPPYKTKYRVMNVHLHCTSVTEAAIRAELEVLDRVGIRAVTILDAGGPDGNLPDWMKLRQGHPDRLIVFWKLDFARIKERTFFADIVRDLEKAAKMGVQGVKVWKDLGMYVRDADDRLLKADDPRLDPFWAKCGKLGLPVLIHTADEKEYWQPLNYNSIHFGLRTEQDQHYNNPEMPPWEELIRQRDAVLTKHPKTKFIGAHVGSQGHDLKQLEVTLARYPNFFVDTSARHRVFGRLNPPAMREFFEKNQDRLLFGTDGTILVKGRKPTGSRNISLYPTVDPNLEVIDPSDKAAVKAWQDREAIMYSQSLQYFETNRIDLLDPMRSGGAWLRIPGIKLPPEVLEKFYHGNAERLIPALSSP